MAIVVESKVVASQSSVPLYVDTFFLNDAPATSGPTFMERWVEVTFGPDANKDFFRPLKAGSITGVWCATVGARTAGTLTMEVFTGTLASDTAGDATGFTAVLDGTNTKYASNTQAAGLDTFEAGAFIALKWTTSGWAPTSADIVAGIEITWD